MTTQTCPPPTKSPADAGFTLIELLVVMAIMAMLALVATAAMPRRSEGLENERFLADLRAAIDDGHTHARESGNAVSIDLASIRSAPSDLTFAPAIGAARTLLIYPDGTTNGGVLKDGGRERFRISWLTVQVTRHAS